MTEAQAADVRAIVVETLAEQQRLRQDDIDAVVRGRDYSDLLRDRKGRSVGAARGFSTSPTVAQERRAGAELYFQGSHHRDRHRVCRSSVARHQGDVGQMIAVELVLSIIRR